MESLVKSIHMTIPLSGMFGYFSHFSVFLFEMSIFYLLQDDHMQEITKQYKTI